MSPERRKRRAEDSVEIAEWTERELVALIYTQALELAQLFKDTGNVQQAESEERKAEGMKQRFQELGWSTESLHQEGKEALKKFESEMERNEERLEKKPRRRSN